MMKNWQTKKTKKKKTLLANSLSALQKGLIQETLDKEIKRKI